MVKTSKKKKKVSKAKTTHKKKKKVKKTTSSPKKRSRTNIDKALTDNFIALQKIMVNVSIKFDNLSNQIAKLLELFEISAKSLARKDFEEDRENKDMKKVLEKLDNVSQHAGLIGKGLALIHEISSEKGQSIMPTQRPMPSIPPKPISQRPIPPRKPIQGMQGYQKSIASRDSEPRTSGSITREI